MGKSAQSGEGRPPPCETVISPAESNLQLDASGEQQLSETATLTILEFGPRNVESGQQFNVQPSGLSAIWVKVDRPLAEKSYIRLNGTNLGGNGKGDRIGAQVPAEMTAIPGMLTLEVVEVIDGQEAVSAPVTFVVK